VTVKNCVQEEGDYRLSPSSTSVAGRLDQLSMNMQTQSVCSRDEADSPIVSSSRMDHG